MFFLSVFSCFFSFPFFFFSFSFFLELYFSSRRLPPTHLPDIRKREELKHVKYLHYLEFIFTLFHLFFNCFRFCLVFSSQLLLGSSLLNNLRKLIIVGFQLFGIIFLVYGNQFENVESHLYSLCLF